MLCVFCISISAFSSNDCHTHRENHYKLSFCLLFLTGLFPATKVKMLPLFLFLAPSLTHSLSLSLSHSLLFIFFLFFSPFFLGNFSHPNFFVRKKTFDCSIAWSERVFLAVIFPILLFIYSIFPWKETCFKRKYPKCDVLCVHDIVPAEHHTK